MGDIKESHHKESFRIIHNLLRNMENMPEVNTRQHSAQLRTEGKRESGTMFALDALSFDWDLFSFSCKHFISVIVNGDRGLV